MIANVWAGHQEVDVNNKNQEPSLSRNGTVFFRFNEIFQSPSVIPFPFEYGK
jgi:hypothetical protein